MRICCIADTHLTVPEPESASLFPRQIAALSKEQGREMYTTMQGVIQSAFVYCMQWLRSNPPWDLLVHLGDVTGGWQEQGCSHQSARKLAEDAKAALVDWVEARKIRFVLGNHDMGYSSPVSLHEKGVNTDSVFACQEIFGDLFWREQGDGILHIGVCSPIAEYKGLDPQITRIRDDQASFVGDVLAGSKEPWALYTHSPFAPRFFAKEIKGHTGRLVNMICGDFHDPRKGRVMKMAAKFVGFPFNSAVIQCLKKCAVCPSTAPLWWQGHGLLSLSEHERKIVIKEILLEPLLLSSKIPTSSFWRCLWWIVRNRKRQPH
jgi:hypothetical protein